MMRPRYHYTAKQNWLSDPNGLVHDGEKWHMCYQYNPHGEDWGHMSWGHATSTDLADWHETPPILLEEGEFMIFSGSAVVDSHNSAGFGAGALVAIYTDAKISAPQLQVQSLAFSTDKGASWRKYAGNPVLDYGMADFRDPNVFWHEASGKWVMALALSKENAAIILVSDDLKAWEQTCRIDGHEEAGQLWECPYLVELPVAGTNTRKWLFKVDAFSGAEGSGALYKIGTFDGRVFTPESEQWLLADYGSDFYAAIGWNGPRDEEGRPVWIGWMGNHHYQAKLPQRGWRGSMSLPRRLGIVHTEQGARLAQSIAPSCLALFGTENGISVGEKLPPEHRLTVGAGFTGALHLSDGKGAEFALAISGDELRIRRLDRCLPVLNLERVITRSNTQGLRLFMDRTSLEILSEDGTLSLGFQHAFRADEITLDCSNYAQLTLSHLA